jgi:hypothetical protein
MLMSKILLSGVIFHKRGCKLTIECAWAGVYPNVELKAALLKITFEKAM